MADALIKTTARLHDAGEPTRQKPLIRIDDRNGGQTIYYYQSNDNNSELTNKMIRASIDSGRDNPFKPDGEIYKMTSPIVDFYLLGPEKARTQTPTYAELNGKDQQSNANTNTPKSTNSRDTTKCCWRRRRQPTQPQQQPSSTGAGSHEDFYANRDLFIQQESCWRKWFCCCCWCCFNRRFTNTTLIELIDEQEIQQATNNNTDSQISANIDYYNTKRNQTSELAKPNVIVVDLTSKTKKLDNTSRKLVNNYNSDSSRSSSKLTSDTTELATSQVENLQEVKEKKKKRKENSEIKRRDKTNGTTTMTIDGDTQQQTRDKSKCIVS